METSSQMEKTIMFINYFEWTVFKFSCLKRSSKINDNALQYMVTGLEVLFITVRVRLLQR